MNRIWWCAVVTGLLALSVVSSAGRVYTWEDDSGVVHFSDQPPSGKQDVSERWMQPPNRIHDSGDAAVSEPGSGETSESSRSGSGSAAGTDVPRGPARVVVTSRMATPVAEQARRVSGEVKNLGGEVAKRVSVFIRITDAGQGTECISGDVDVEPGLLAPGDTGKFEEFIETPCFLGNAGVEIEPDWD